LREAARPVHIAPGMLPHDHVHARALHGRYDVLLSWDANRINKATHWGDWR
jgi:hypothetical protein